MKAGAMNQNPLPKTHADCSPVFSIAGVMPGASNAAWKTAYPNPDAGHSAPKRSHGPTFSIAGAMPAGTQTPWRTSCPDPTRDVLDAYGHVITKVEAAARAELASTRKALMITAAKHHPHAA
jgi:hypothetical protein